ncbi:MAG TPA: cytochrome c [Phycisphaerales bacterium]
MKVINNTTSTLTTLALIAGSLSVLSGCRGDRSDAPPRQFFPNMDDSPKWKPQTGSTFFADKRTMRPSPANAVAFGRTSSVSDEAWNKPWAEQRVALLREGEAEYSGTSGVNSDGSPRYIDRIPISVSADLVKLGQAKFNIYCAVCHGYDGAGKGMVGQAWSYALPNFHDAKYKDVAQYTGKDGYLFHVVRYGVITQGQQKMPGYAHALNEKEAWAVVAYFRALQESRAVPMDDASIPESERAALREKMMQATTPTNPATNPATPAPAAPQAAPNAAPQGGAK